MGSYLLTRSHLNAFGRQLGLRRRGRRAKSWHHTGKLVSRQISSPKRTEPNPSHGNTLQSSSDTWHGQSGSAKGFCSGALAFGLPSSSRFYLGHFWCALSDSLLDACASSVPFPLPLDLSAWARAFRVPKAPMPFEEAREAATRLDFSMAIEPNRATYPKSLTKLCFFKRQDTVEKEGCLTSGRESCPHGTLHINRPGKSPHLSFGSLFELTNINA